LGENGKCGIADNNIKGNVGKVAIWGRSPINDAPVDGSTEIFFELSIMQLGGSSGKLSQGCNGIADIRLGNNVGIKELDC
jgi:hypothetical protein